jgi:hypothetical protein
VTLAVMWRFLLCACELIQVFVCKEETGTVMPEGLGTTLKNLVARATRHPECVHPSFRRTWTYSGARFYTEYLGVSLSCHSAKDPRSYSPLYCPQQKDKRAKPGNLQSVAVCDTEQHWAKRLFHIVRVSRL